jgi:hypothetical protein
MARARSLMDTNVLKVTALVKELEAQRDQLQTDITAAQKREEVRLCCYETRGGEPRRVIS